MRRQGGKKNTTHIGEKEDHYARPDMGPSIATAKNERLSSAEVELGKRDWDP